MLIFTDPPLSTTRKCMFCTLVKTLTILEVEGWGEGVEGCGGDEGWRGSTPPLLYIFSHTTFSPCYFSPRHWYVGQPPMVILDLPLMASNIYRMISLGINPHFYIEFCVFIYHLRLQCMHSTMTIDRAPYHSTVESSDLQHHPIGMQHVLN